MEKLLLFCFGYIQLARSPDFQNLFENFIYLLLYDVSKPQNGLFQKKFKQGGGGGWGYTFVKTVLEHSFFYFISGNSRQNKSQLLDIPQNCVPLETPRPKKKFMEIPHNFFLTTLGNSTSFLINHQKFHMLFL